MVNRSSVFEKTNSIFSITDENNFFEWTPEGSGDIIEKLKKFQELRSQNDFELHAKELENRSNRIEIRNRGYNLTSLDPFESETLAELRRVKFNDLQ